MRCKNQIKQILIDLSSSRWPKSMWHFALSRYRIHFILEQPTQEFACSAEEPRATASYRDSPSSLADIEGGICIRRALTNRPQVGFWESTNPVGCTVPRGITTDMFRYRAAWVVPSGAVNEAECAFRGTLWGQHRVTGLAFRARDG